MLFFVLLCESFEFILVSLLRLFFYSKNGRVMMSPGKSDVDGWTVTQITILNVSRSDDGLYSCVSENQGGQVERKGHITVQRECLTSS